jgi:hypothetical protein
MKTSFFLRLAAGLTLALVVLGVRADDASTTVEMARAILHTERKEVVAGNLILSKDEADRFWPLYNEYHAEMDKVSDRAIRVVRTYVENMDKLTDELASTLLRDQIAVERSQLLLRDTYMKKFAQALPPKKLARYFQIENKLDALIRARVAQEVPLVPTGAAGER